MALFAGKFEVALFWGFFVILMYVLWFLAAVVVIGLVAWVIFYLWFTLYDYCFGTKLVDWMRRIRDNPPSWPWSKKGDSS